MHPGAVIAQYARCGKAGCRCARGELHGPYWYVFRRVGGRLRKTYLRRYSPIMRWLLTVTMIPQAVLRRSGAGGNLGTEAGGAPRSASRLVVLLHLQVDFFAVDGQGPGGGDADTDLIAAYFNDGDLDGRFGAVGIPDRDGLVEAAGENEQSGSSLGAKALRGVCLPIPTANSMPSRFARCRDVKRPANSIVGGPRSCPSRAVIPPYHAPADVKDLSSVHHAGRVRSAVCQCSR